MILLYFTFVYPHSLYGIAVYANIHSSRISKLQILNNKLLRIAQDCSIRTKINTLYKSYNTSPITVLHSYQILSFVHKCLFNSHLLPSLFHGYFDLNSSVHSYSTSYRINYCTLMQRAIIIWYEVY